MSNLDLGFSFSPKSFIKEGFRAFVCSMSGGGKSHSAKVMIEELYKTGYPIIIIDPEGEYASLSEFYTTIIVGGSYADLPLKDSVVRDTIELVLTNDEPLIIIYDVSNLLITDQSVTASTIQKELFVKASKYRRAIFFVVEECQLIAPQMPRKGQKTESLDIAIDIAKRGRKRGINSIWITQRPAGVSKEIISQCNYWFIGRLIIQNDLDHMKNYLKQAGIKVTELMSLTQQFYLYNGQETILVKFRDLQIKDLAKTPELKEQFELKRSKNKSVSSVLKDILAKIEREQVAEQKQTSELEKLRKQNDQLKEDKKELQGKIQQVTRDLELISKIQVTTGGKIDNKEFNSLLEKKRELEQKLKQRTTQLKELQEQYRVLSESVSIMNEFEKVKEKLIAQVNALQLTLTGLTAPEQPENERPTTTIILEEFDDQEVILNGSTGVERRIGFIKHPIVKSIIRGVITNGSSETIVKLILGFLTQKEEATYEDLRRAGNYADKSNISKVARRLANRKIINSGKGSSGSIVLSLNLEGLQEIIELYQTKQLGEQAIADVFGGD